jgi:hypothetical protein
VSLCDKCRDPGACCREFPLLPFDMEAHPTKLHAYVFAATWVYFSPDKDRVLLGFPFAPLYKDVANSCWRWKCLNLTDDGRCGDYENRPHDPCVSYMPGEDNMCAMASPVSVRNALESKFPSDSPDYDKWLKNALDNNFPHRLP